MAAREIGVVMQRLANGRGCTAAQYRSGILWAWLDRVAAREGIEPPLGPLVDGGLEDATVCHPVGLHGDGRALGDITAAVVAGVDCLLEDVNVPAIQLV
jgi:hypothetical protein